MKLKKKIIKLKDELKNINILKIKEDIYNIKNNINNSPINNQLINIINDKNKKIKEQEQELNKNQQIIQPIIEKQKFTKLKNRHLKYAPL